MIEKPWSSDSDIPVAIALVLKDNVGLASGGLDLKRGRKRRRTLVSVMMILRTMVLEIE